MYFSIKIIFYQAGYGAEQDSTDETMKLLQGSQIYTANMHSTVNTYRKQILKYINFAVGYYCSTH